MKLKIKELEKIERINSCNMLKKNWLIKKERRMVRELKGRDINKENLNDNENNRIIEKSIEIESDRIIKILYIDDDYEKKLKEF